MKLAPMTKFSDVITQLNELLTRGEYQDPNTFVMRQIKRDCEKVRDISPARGWSLLSCYYSLVGNVEEVERCFTASTMLERVPVVIENHHATMVNHGFFSRAHDFFTKEARPETGMFSGLACKGFHAGSISTVISYYERALELGMEGDPEVYADALKAQAILSRAMVSEEQVVRHLDAIGVVLREYLVFNQGDPEIESIDIDGVLSSVSYVFRVNRPSNVVFDMNVRLAVCEDEMKIERNMAFDTMFLPA